MLLLNEYWLIDWLSSFLTAHLHSLGYLVPVMVSWIENYNQKGLNSYGINTQLWYQLLYFYRWCTPTGSNGDSSVLLNVN